MAKNKQLVARIDDDLAAFLEKTSGELGRAQAQLVCAALHVFSKLEPEALKRALAEYLTRDLTAGAPPPKRGKK